MTRSEARMVAEEFYKLMRRDERLRSLETGKSYSKEWIGSKAAADMLDCTKKTLYSHIEDIPHVRVGNRYKFKKSELLKYLEDRYG